MQFSERILSWRLLSVNVGGTLKYQLHMSSLTLVKYKNHMFFRSIFISLKQGQDEIFQLIVVNM